MSNKNIGIISLKGVDYNLSDIDLREEFTNLQENVNNNLTNLDNKITEEVSKIVSNAPEDFDTLKEMSDWISSHKEDASAMNSAILDNTNSIQQITNKTYQIQRYGSNNGRYIKLGSIPVSKGGVSFASLRLSIFGDNKAVTYPIGYTIVNISSGASSDKFNINGLTTIPLNETSTVSPRILVTKTSDRYYLYVDCAYNYLKLLVEELFTNGYTNHNFEQSNELSGTTVYTSVTNKQIKYLGD